MGQKVIVKGCKLGYTRDNSTGWSRCDEAPRTQFFNEHKFFSDKEIKKIINEFRSALQAEKICQPKR